ncbi:MAG: NUDIX hydrolase [Planctomycetes bacterium]|nr:NUDIX hydrolase [Planctomycetota bacterium]
MAKQRLGRPRETGRKGIYRGKIFRVSQCSLRFRNGERAVHDLVEHDGAAVFVPIPEPGKLILIRQYRHAARGYLWEIPAGRLEKGERPLAAAKRELAEECGLTARRWHKAASFLPAPGYTDEVMHLFFAYDLAPDQSGARPDQDEEIEMRTFSLAEISEWMRSGRIRDGKTLVAFAYLLAQTRAE